MNSQNPNPFPERNVADEFQSTGECCATPHGIPIPAIETAVSLSETALVGRHGIILADSFKTCHRALSAWFPTFNDPKSSRWIVDRPAAPQTRGWWICCTCGREVNPAVYGDVCPDCGHCKCDHYCTYL
ncbi:hypothetical protein BDZ45DRAFT_391002 [Acephala macrosclerotiorum]|nr:hypothetical protein BDZ45DRAFT_391002 [Acephala macrosclerotiorum]